MTEQEGMQIEMSRQREEITLLKKENKFMTWILGIVVVATLLEIVVDVVKATM